MDSNREIHSSIKINLKYYMLLTVGIMLIMVWSSVCYRSMQNFHKGEFYFNTQEYIKAITYFDRSIHWYAPFNPYVKKSVQRIWAIGKQAKEKENIKLALIAYRTIRNGFFGAYSFYQPGIEWIEQCEKDIFDLTKLKIQEKWGQKRSESLRKKDVFKEKANRPEILWTVIVEIGFWGWIAAMSVYIFIRFSSGTNSKIRILAVRKCYVLLICFYILWIMGMIKA